MADGLTVGRVGRVREYAKTSVRSLLYSRNLDLVKDPFPCRVAKAMAWLGVSTCFDIGANIGQYGAALRASGFAGDLISCEPVSDSFAHLAKRAAKDPRWTTLHTAVGAELGTLDLNVSANSYSSSALPLLSTHEGAAPDSRFIRVESVPVTTVSDLVESRRIDASTAMLKVDTQGYEGPVLDGAGELVAQFALIQLELSVVPLYDGQQLMTDLVARLESHGLSLFALDAGFSDPKTGKMLQCDGLFIRNDLADTPAPR